MSKKQNLSGAGGTSGGVGEFLLSILMMCGGGYLLLDAMQVRTLFSMRYSLYSYGGFNITSGYVLIPLMFGIGMIFYNAKNKLGWLLTLGSSAALIFGVISSVQITLKSMSMFSLSVIIVLFIGGLGLFLKSLKEH